MKFFNFLSIVQTLAIGVLVWQVYALHNIPEAQSDADAPQSSPAPVAITGTTSDIAGSTLSSDDIRQIIRQELSRALAAPEEAPPVADTPMLDPIEQQARWQLFEEELAHYIDKGEISDVEMNQLQANIGRLHPDDQKTAIIRLTQAMNEGRVKGRL